MADIRFHLVYSQELKVAFHSKKPCKDCPFTRGGVKLREGRIEELHELMTQSGGGSFSCHKTVDYSKMSEDDGEHDTGYIPGVNEMHCTGALIYAEKHDNQTQMMRVMGRCGGYDPDELMASDDVERVWDSIDEWLEEGVG